MKYKTVKVVLEELTCRIDSIEKKKNNRANYVRICELEEVVFALQHEVYKLKSEIRQIELEKTLENGKRI